MFLTEIYFSFFVLGSNHLSHLALSGFLYVLWCEFFFLLINDLLLTNCLIKVVKTHKMYLKNLYIEEGKKKKKDLSKL